MSFAHPWALVLLAGLPLLWLVRHEPPRRRVAVAGRFLWTPRPHRDAALGRTPFHHKLLWVQAALLTALVLSLAGPRFDTTPDTVALVIDASMSMGARESDGRRIDAARRRAVEALRAQGAAVRVRVWAARATPAFAGEAGAGNGLDRLLASVEPTDGWSDLDGAIARARQDSPPPRRILVISDRQVPLTAPDVEWTSVGGAADNVAVTSLVAAPDETEPNRLHVMAEVHNFGRRDTRVTLTLSMPGLEPSRHVVGVGSRRTAGVGISWDGAARSGVVTARLEDGDALAADDVRYAVVRPAAPSRIAVEGVSPFVDAALLSLRGVIRAAPADAAGVLRIVAGSGDSGEPVVVTRPDHPVVKGASLDALRVVPAPEAAVGEGAIVLARAGNRPVVLASEVGGRRVVELRFDPAGSAVALEPSFPLLVANAIDWLGDARRPPESVRAGDPFRWQAGQDAVVVDSTSIAGPQDVTLGGERMTFVANPATDDESDLSRAPTPSPGLRESTAAATLAERDLFDAVAPLLLAALVLVVIEWRVRVVAAHGVGRALPRPRVLVRAAAAVLLIAALAGLQVWTGSAPVAVAFVLDRSDSTAASFASWLKAARDLTATLGTADQVGLTVFADDAVVERRVQEGGLPAGAVESTVTTSGTNIERALQTARASLPPAGDRRIILFSDGRQTSGDAAREGVRAAAAGVRIDVVAAAAAPPIARATRVMAPATVRIGEPFELAVVVEGPPGVAGTLQVMGAGAARSERVTLGPAGVQRVTFSERSDTAGLQTFRAAFTPDVADFPIDGGIESAAAGTMVSVGGTPRALYAGGHGDRLGPMLRASGFQVEPVTATAIPVGRMLAAFDAVVLDEVDPLALRQDQRAALAQYVDEGGGLLVLGTEASLPAAPSGDAGFDALLPVDTRPRSGERGSALALVVAFDKSGSMEERVAGTPKIEFARQAVKNVVAALPAGDAIGVIAFDSTPATVSPLGTSRDQAALETALRAVRPAGATAIGPALARAVEWLNAPEAGAFDKKHVLLISDGQTSADDLARARRAADSGRIVLSVVAVGAGDNQTALNAMALASGGRAYFADDVRDLPGAVAREAGRVAGGRTVVASFEGRMGSHALARGLDGAPRLGGYVVTAPRPGTDVVMRSHLDDPVLAVGRRGLGRVAVYTADLHSEWSAGLVQWPGFGSLVARTMRWVSRASDHPVLHASMSATASAIEIDVEAGADARLLASPLELQGTLRAPAGNQVELVFRALAPGRFVAASPTGPAGPYVASVTATSADGALQGTLVRGVYYNAPQELDHADPDLGLLGNLAATTGGRLLASNAVAIDTRRPGYRDGRPWFAAAALLLLFADLVMTGVVRAAADRFRRFGREPQVRAA